METVGEKGFFGCVPLSEFNFDSIRKVGSRAFNDTAVMNAPSSKSHCFSKDSFGSALDNAFKFVVKKKYSIITSYITVKFSISSVAALIKAVSAEKDIATITATLNKLKSDKEMFHRLGFQELALTDKGSCIDYAKTLENNEKKIAYAEAQIKSLNKWKWIATATIIATAVVAGLSVYLWETET